MLKVIDCVKDIYKFVKIQVILAAILFVLGYIADVPPAYALGIILLIASGLQYYKAHDYVSFKMHSRVKEDEISFSSFVKWVEAELIYKETSGEKTFMILPKGKEETSKEVSFQNTHHYKIMNHKGFVSINVSGYFFPDYNIFVAKISPQKNIFPEKRELPYYHITSGGRIRIIPSVNSVICKIEGSMRDIEKIDVFLETEDGVRKKVGELREHGESIEIPLGVERDTVILINEPIMSFRELLKNIDGIIGCGTYKIIFKLPAQELETKVYVEC